MIGMNNSILFKLIHNDLFISMVRSISLDQNFAHFDPIRTIQNLSNTSHKYNSNHTWSKTTYYMALREILFAKKFSRASSTIS